MDSKLSSAEKKVWETPELVEKLLPFLDPESTLALAQCQETVPSILQGTLLWNQFIRRACPFTEEGNRLTNIDVVRCLVAVMKLMKNPDKPRQDLLELICERFPPKRFSGRLQMGCSSHQEGHCISVEGLVLLDEVERGFGSTDLKIETIYSDDGYWNDSEWSALSGTLTRCQEIMTLVEIGDFEISNVTSLKAFRTMLQFCPAASTSLGDEVVLDLRNVAMVREFKNLLLFCPDLEESLVIILNSNYGHDDIGNEGWALFAKAVQLRSGFVRKISCMQHVLQESTKEDMRVIWEVVGDIQLVHDFGNENFKRRDGEKAWRRLAQVMDMTEDELNRDKED